MLDLFADEKPWHEPLASGAVTLLSCANRRQRPQAILIFNRMLALLIAIRRGQNCLYIRIKMSLTCERLSSLYRWACRRFFSLAAYGATIP